MSQGGVLGEDGVIPPDIPTTFQTDNGSAVPIANTLEVLGNLAAAGSDPVSTSGSGNTVTINVQTAQAIASTNATNVGLAAFNSADFSVDANGFVSLDTPPEDLTITGDTGGPISPSVGNWNLLGQGIPSTSGIQINGTGSTLSARMLSPYTLDDFTFQNSTASTSRLVRVRNLDTNSSSTSILRISVAGASAADPYLQVSRESGSVWCWGADTSESDTLKICQDANSNTATPSGGTLLWSMTTAGLQKIYFGQAVGYTAPAGGSFPYNILTSDFFVSVDTSGARTVRLPNAPTTGQFFTIKDRTGSAGSNNISVTTVGGVVNIDGATTYTMNVNFGSARFLFNGTSYEVF